MNRQQKFRLPHQGNSGQGKAERKGFLRREGQHFKKNRELFMMSLPGVIFKLIFAYLPLFGLIIAFKEYRYDLGLWGSKWIGFDNFTFFFSSDAALTITLNTLLYNFSFIVVGTAVALLLAILLNSVSQRFLKAYQTVLFLPHFLSWVVVGYIVLAFLDHQHGLLNVTLADLGWNPVKWYQEAGHWPFIIVLAQLWKTVGFATLIYYAGIIGIDPSYYEVAKLEGASRFQVIRKITLPLLTPLIIILFIVDMGKIFRSDFGLFYFIPNDSSFLYGVTDVIDTYVYRSLRVAGNVGMSTAVGLYQSVVGFILVLSTNAIIRKLNKDNALW